MKTPELITLGIAIVSLLLSLRNAWRDYRRDKVLLRVIPKAAFPVGPMPNSGPCFAFEIINEGVFPVTVDDVGFLVSGTRHRFSLTQPIVVDGGTWPRRVEPHSAVTVYSATLEKLSLDVRRIRCAYAATASGRVIRGHSKALKEIVQSGGIPAPRVTLSRQGSPGMLAVSDFDM